jgi:hypothetical protein
MSTLCRFAERMPLRFSLLAVSILQLLVVVVIRPSYETIDDVLMTMAVSGKGISLAPDQHLVFTNILIGDVLKWLYTTAPSLPWYGLYLLAVHFVAQSAILYCALTIGRTVSNERQTGVRLGLYLLCFGLVELQFLNRMQFTTTAFVAAEAGVFSLLLAWRRRVLNPDASVLGPVTTAVALLVLGGMIRLESLAMALLAAGPLVLLFVQGASRRTLIPCGVAAIVAAVLVAGAVVHDRSAYEQDPQWQGYRALNRLRGNFHDSSFTYYAPETASVFARAGWSENDHAMIARWFSDDAGLYNSEKLTGIVSAYPWRASRDMSFLAWDALRDIGRNRTVLAVLLALPFVLMMIPRGEQARATVLASALATLPLLVLVVWLKKVPPERVYLPIVSFPLWAALVSFAWPFPTSENAASRFSVVEYVQSWWIWAAWRRLPTKFEIATTMLIAAVVMGDFHQVRQTMRVAKARAELKQFLSEVRSDGRKLCVMWEAALPLDLVSPLDTLDEWSDLPMLSIAWPQCTPWQEAIKRKFRISNLARALYERNDIILIATDDHRKLFQTFAQEHFGAQVEFVTFQRSGDQLVAGCFHRYGSAGDTAARPSTEVSPSIAY